MDKRTRKLMHSSKDMDAVTPQDFYEQMNREFNFELDLAADESNTKCKYYYDEEANSLKQPWEGRCWCNPPYGRGVIAWVNKAAYEAGCVRVKSPGPLVVMLLVPRTDTEWFRIAAQTADEIRFIKGRLQFEGQPNKAPFPSCVVIWYGSHNVAPYKKRDDDKYTYNLIWRR
jgi:phage N-6-adenine-methyltransferase